VDERSEQAVGLAETLEAVELSVVIPARNEQDVLGACLASLTAQSELAWELGKDWELIVVDDASTDGTREIAASTPGVTILDAPKLETGASAGFTGKTNACWAGAQAARGKLLVFTDADTVHEPGSLSRARHELERYEVGMLSYSPRQLTSGFLQKILMPLVFAELSIAYPMKRVNDPADRTAAANGQFLMVESEAYFAVGGHRGIGRDVLEDVALARAFKRQRKGLRFRYAPDALATRMYRSTAMMMEGWTKNLALLFTNPVAMALMRLLDFLLIVGIPMVTLIYPFLTTLQRTLLWVVWLRVLWRFYARVAKSNFPALDCALSVLGLPLFAYLLMRSTMQVRLAKAVEWKGRSYRTGTG
jgi:glycosyltransferase involved in cell wall biosynthesis